MTEETKKDRKLVDEFIIPKASGKAFLVDKGQTMNVIGHEGPQVVDIKFFNAHDYREQFAAYESCQWNSVATSSGVFGKLHGGFKKITKLFSRRPWCNVMATVIDDPVGDHLFGPSCCPFDVTIWPELAPEGKTCWEIYCDVLRPYGICEADIDPSSTFDCFMATRVMDDEVGTFKFLEPPFEKGNHIEFRMEMDLLVASVSCADTNVINAYKPKGHKIQIFE